MRKHVLILVLIVSLVFAISANAMASTEIRFQHNDTPQSAWHHGFEYAAEYIEENLPDYEVRIYHSGELAGGDWSVILDQVQENIVQGFVEFPGTYATLDERFFSLMLPYLFDGRDHWNTFWEDPPPVVESWLEELEETQDISIISVWSRNFRGFLNTERPIEYPDDMDGLTFRVPDMPLFIDVFEALGANPIPMPSGEIYTALQMGTIQGEDNSPETVYTFATYEPADYYTVSEYISDGALVSVNSDWWHGLPEEEKEVIEEAFDRAGDYVHEFETELFEEAIEAFEEDGMEVTFLDDEQKEAFYRELQPIYDQMREILGDEDFQALLDAVEEAR